MPQTLVTDPWAPRHEAVTAYIGLGANLGPALLTLKSALQILASQPEADCQLLACSSFYRSAPVDAEGPDFINAVAMLKTTQAPLKFLRWLQELEAQHQRQRPYRNAPRTLDLDLLLWGNCILQEPELQLPHPRMHSRAFVLLPLAELTPDLEIPTRGSVLDLLSGLAHQPIERLAVND